MKLLVVVGVVITTGLLLFKGIRHRRRFGGWRA